MGNEKEIPSRPGLNEGDLRGEVKRTYHFASGHEYHIFDPVTLYTRPGGTTHRVLDETGTVHCIAFPGPNADTIVTWQPKQEDKPVSF